MRNRAKEIFPMVLLTLLSIVQALALEFLWDHTRHRSDLFELSIAVIPGWLQLSGHQGWFRVVVLAAVFVAIGYETHKTAAYWRDSMGSEK